MIGRKQIPTWRKIGFGSELAEEDREEDGGDNMGIARCEILNECCKLET